MLTATVLGCGGEQSSTSTDGKGVAPDTPAPAALSGTYESDPSDPIESLEFTGDRYTIRQRQCAGGAGCVQTGTFSLDVDAGTLTLHGDDGTTTIRTFKVIERQYGTSIIGANAQPRVWGLIAAFVTVFVLGYLMGKGTAEQKEEKEYRAAHPL
jgi:hypothetical protein